MTETTDILRKYGYSVTIDNNLIKIERKGSGCLMAYFIGLAAFILYCLVDLTNIGIDRWDSEEYVFLAILWSMLSILVVLICVNETTHLFEVANEKINFVIGKKEGNWPLSKIRDIQRKERIKEKFWGYRSYRQELVIYDKDGNEIELLSFMSSQEDPIEEMNRVRCFFEEYLKKNHQNAHVVNV